MVLQFLKLEEEDSIINSSAIISLWPLVLTVPFVTFTVCLNTVRLKAPYCFPARTSQKPFWSTSGKEKVEGGNPVLVGKSFISRIPECFNICPTIVLDNFVLLRGLWKCSVSDHETVCNVLSEAQILTSYKTHFPWSIACKKTSLWVISAPPVK